MIASLNYPNVKSYVPMGGHTVPEASPIIGADLQMLLLCP